jgi:hypothetical protein
MYTPETAVRILEKFRLLEEKEDLRIPIISQRSMVKNFPAFFGCRCDYFAERFYHYLSGPN